MNEFENFIAIGPRNGNIFIFESLVKNEIFGNFLTTNWFHLKISSKLLQEQENF